MTVRLYLGAHQPHWLADLRRTDVPLFVSHRRLRGYRRLPVAAGPWALDSGGFTELAMHGRWETTAAEYVEAVRRYDDEIGGLDWAAPMDWMCEPMMLAKTGLTVAGHQARTVANYLLLRRLWAELTDRPCPIRPVLQGWDLADYLRCAALYADAGVDLAAEPLVGVGSVCRRQHTGEIGAIFEALAGLGLALHGFGVKSAGLRLYGDQLASADSLAWSYAARRLPPLPQCRGRHINCANCMRFALRWRQKLLVSVAAAPVQLSLGLRVAS